MNSVLAKTCFAEAHNPYPNTSMNEYGVLLILCLSLPNSKRDLIFETLCPKPIRSRVRLQYFTPIHVYIK